jgi:hypothetical protein
MDSVILDSALKALLKLGDMTAHRMHHQKPIPTETIDIEQPIYVLAVSGAEYTVHSSAQRFSLRLLATRPRTGDVEVAISGDDGTELDVTMGSRETDMERKCPGNASGSNFSNLC